MPGGINVHVVPQGDEWVVTLEEDTEPVSTHPTEEEAVVEGRRIAMDEQSELLIHGHDGDVKERDSYRPGLGP
jgi:Uncharacterized protein conserved in bacteria (DUF2188)